MVGTGFIEGVLRVNPRGNFVKSRKNNVGILRALYSRIFLWYIEVAFIGRAVFCGRCKGSAWRGNVEKLVRKIVRI